MQFKHLKGVLAATVVVAGIGGAVAETQTQSPLVNAQSSKTKAKASKDTKKTKPAKKVYVKVNSAPKEVKHKAVNMNKAKLDKGYKGYKKSNQNAKHSKPIAKDKHGKKVKNAGMSDKQMKHMKDFYANSNKTKKSKHLTHKQAKASEIQKSNVKIDK